MQPQTMFQGRLGCIWSADEKAMVVVPPVPSKPIQAHNQQNGILLHAQVQYTGSTGLGKTQGACIAGVPSGICF